MPYQMLSSAAIGILSENFDSGDLKYSSSVRNRSWAMHCPIGAGNDFVIVGR